MVHGMASSAIDHGRVCNVFSVVNENGPDIYEAEERNVCEFL